jgi:hypothetical protein
MSHDRGCFRCHEDHPGKFACPQADCPYKDEYAAHLLTKQRAVVVGVDAGSRWDAYGEWYVGKN